MNRTTKMKEVRVKVESLAGKYNIHPTTVVKDGAGKLKMDPKRVANAIAEY